MEVRNIYKRIGTPVFRPEGGKQVKPKKIREESAR